MSLALEDEKYLADEGRERGCLRQRSRRDQDEKWPGDAPVCSMFTH